jgi:hypothetical protein
MNPVGVNDVSRNTATGQSDKEDEIRAHNLHLAGIYIDDAKGIHTRDVARLESEMLVGLFWISEFSLVDCIRGVLPAAPIKLLRQE